MTEFLDVSVKTPNAEIDLRLPESEAVRGLLGEIIANLRSDLTDRDAELGTERSAADLLWLNDKDARWSLVTQLGAPLRPDATLRELNVRNGQTLILMQNAVREQYPRLIDDTPQAIAEYQRRNFATWERPQSRLLTLAVLLFFGTLAPVAGVYMVMTQNPGWATRGAVMGAFSFAAVACLLVSGTVGNRVLPAFGRIDDALASVMAACGYFSILAAGQVLFPGGNVLWGAVVSAGVLAAVSMAMLRVNPTIVSVHYGALFLAGNILLTVLIFGGLQILTRKVGQFEFPHNTTVAAIQLAVTTVGTLLMSERWAMSLTQIPMPHVPTIGEDFIKDRTTQLSQLPLDSGSEALEEIINHEPQVVRARQTIIGFFGGGLLLIAGAITTAMATLQSHPLVTLVFSLSVSLAMVFRGRSYDDAVMTGMWLSAAAVTMGGAAVGAAIAANGPYLTVILALAAAGALTAAIYSLSFTTVRSPLSLHKTEILEWILYASLLLDLALVMELWQTVRAH